MISKYPLVKFTIIFILGIIFGSVFKVDLLIQLFIILSVLILSIIIFQKAGENIVLLKSVLLLLSIFLIGSAYYSVRVSEQNKYLFKYPKYKNVLINGTIDKIELIRDGRLTFKLISNSISAGAEYYKERYNILCSVYDQKKEVQNIYQKLAVGNEILFQAYIQRPRDQRNPYEFDYEKYLNDREIIAVANAYSTTDLKVLNNKSDGLKNSIFQIRKYLGEKISSLHNKTTSSMLRGLILADRSEIDFQINQDFINAGVVHVLSVSGLHVGYIVIIFLFLFSRMNLYWRISLTLLGLFLYMIITGSEAPVFRSTIMVSVILCVPLLGRESNSLNSLSLAALMILIINPKELFNPSFQLSFSAILTLIILFPSIKNSVNSLSIKSKLIKNSFLFLGSTIAAQVGTMPFILVYFGRISVTSLIANIFVIPISGLLVGIGIVSLFIQSFSTWLATIYASVNELLTFGMLYLVRFFGNPRYSFINIRQFTLYDSIIFYIMLGIIFSTWKYLTSKKSKIIFLVLSIITAITLFRIDNFELLPENKLSILMIDVGQGDSFLIKFPNTQTALIDAGNATIKFDTGKRIIEPLLEKIGIDKLDYVFVSHVDDDHFKGLYSIISDGKVGTIIKPEVDSSQTKDIQFEKYITEHKLSITYYSRKEINIGNTKLYFLTVGDTNSNISTNDRSGIIKLLYGKTSFLFTGDASIKKETQLVDSYSRFLESNVLKVAHHGSKSSTSDRFLGTVDPNIALISAGIMNKFKHPHISIVEKLNDRKISTYRTDLSGAILLQSDGDKINKMNWSRDSNKFVNF
jgi:competence protein ComEC